MSTEHTVWRDTLMRVPPQGPNPFESEQDREQVTRHVHALHDAGEAYRLAYRKAYPEDGPAREIDPDAVSALRALCESDGPRHELDDRIPEADWIGWDHIHQYYQDAYETNEDVPEPDILYEAFDDFCDRVNIHCPAKRP